MTNTSPRSETPSISVSSAATTLSVTEFFELPRTGARASISSKKRIAGATARAREKTSRTARSDSPTHLSSSSCLLYTSDAADDLLCVDLGGRRIIKKKKKKIKHK